MQLSIDSYYRKTNHLNHSKRFVKLYYHNLNWVTSIQTTNAVNKPTGFQKMKLQLPSSKCSLNRKQAVIHKRAIIGKMCFQYVMMQSSHRL